MGHYSVENLNDEGVTIHQAGNVGANAELSRFVLDSSDIIDEEIKRMQGFVTIFEEDKDGNIIEKTIRVEISQYNAQCVSWFRGKLREILNKNMYLSNLDADDFRQVATEVGLNFTEELWLNWKNFELNDAKYSGLCKKYINYLQQVIRHPLDKGIRAFLTSTTQETTSRVDQRLTESQEKKGIFGLLGR